jgi:hypothetical protein
MVDETLGLLSVTTARERSFGDAHEARRTGHEQGSTPARDGSASVGHFHWGELDEVRIAEGRSALTYFPRLD